MVHGRTAPLTVTHPGILDVTTATVMLQFHVPDINKVPGAQELEQDQDSLTADGQQRVPGVQFIQPSPQVTGHALPSQLIRAGYRLFDAYRQERRADKGGTHWVLRFLFGRAEETEIPGEVASYLDQSAAVITKLFTDALWDVRAWHNCYYEKNRPIKDRFAISINFSGRDPYRNTKGEALLVYPRDVRGHKIPGKKKRPVHPQATISIVNSNILLIPVKSPR